MTLFTKYSNGEPVLHDKWGSGKSNMLKAIADESGQPIVEVRTEKPVYVRDQLPLLYIKWITTALLLWYKYMPTNYRNRKMHQILQIRIKAIKLLIDEFE